MEITRMEGKQGTTVIKEPITRMMCNNCQLMCDLNLTGLCDKCRWLARILDRLFGDMNES